MADPCKVCGAATAKVFDKELLQKYRVGYYQCSNCKFTQTEKPYWLEEAYNSAIAKADIGILERNMRLSDFVAEMIKRSFNVFGRFLDYAGGYGIFTRIMRDKGFDFYHEDPFCENVYARFFSSEDLKDNNQKYDLVTAFEVMEHLENPEETVSEILNRTDSFFFSTELQPKTDLENWWYILPTTGQHISFYTKKALEIIAQKANASFYTDNRTLHLITRKNFEKNPLIMPPKTLKQKIKNRIKRIFIKPEVPIYMETLLQKDFQVTLAKLKGEN